MNELIEDQKEFHRRVLIQEALEDKIKRETLPNSAYAFSGSLLANYAAKSRTFMDSVLAHMIMDNHREEIDNLYWVMSRGK